MSRDPIATTARSWHRSTCRVILCAGMLAGVGSWGSTGPVAADDFIRGDANNDGVVTLSDGHAVMHFLFFTGEGIACGDAADVDNDGRVDLTDGVRVIQYVVLGREPPESPFPGAGPDDGLDEETDTQWPCDDYGTGEPLEDPAARLWIVDAIAPGGADGRVVLRLAMANGARAAGYYVEVDGGGIFAPRTADPNDGVFDLSQTFSDGFLGVAEGAGGVLRVGFVCSFFGALAIPPGDGAEVLEIQLCLAPGTPAGAYPIELHAAEIADLETGRRILPETPVGHLVVLEDVTEEDCVIEPSNPRITRFLNVTFQLEDSVGFRGSEVEMPFLVRASEQAITNGLQFSVDFDEGVLQLLAVEPALERPDGEPWWTRLAIDNTDATPGNAGIDEGYGAGYYVYGDWAPGFCRECAGGSDVHFPIDEQFTAVNLRFLVKEDAPFGSTEVRFVDGGILCFGEADTSCYPTDNLIFSGQSALPPSLVDSFVLVNGLLSIIPDTTPFVRGDSNSDDLVNISDAQFTLSYLFLGIGSSTCLDAADANDDGTVDISDPIGTLEYLFSGTQSALPPPHGSAGPDPTRDELWCLPRLP